jgi:hypothetical protein
VSGSRPLGPISSSNKETQAEFTRGTFTGYTKGLIWPGSISRAKRLLYTGIPAKPVIGRVWTQSRRWPSYIHSKSTGDPKTRAIALV